MNQIVYIIIAVVLAVAASALFFVIVRWLILKPIAAMTEYIKSILAGRTGPTVNLPNLNFFHPLAEQISRMSKSLAQARSAASEEARLRLEKIDAPWTAERLKEFIKAYLKNRKIFVVSNREPFIHKKVNGKIQYVVPASGAVTALEPVMEACGGLWLAYGSGDADKLTVDAQDKIQVPPDEPKYTLKRVWLTEQEIKGYYTGFSNEALWPLCHMAHTRPIFRKEDWQEYRRVNGKFAQSLLSEIKGIEQPLVLVQDFHFALLPQMIKRARPDAQVSLFWHIPWPSAESFSICPWRKEIVVGMLGADVVGFQTQLHCNNFMDTAKKEIESLVDQEQFSVTHEKHTAYIKPFPVSIAFSNDHGQTQGTQKTDSLLEKFGVKTKSIGLGVDRLDYIKGIPERFTGIDFFFNEHPEYIGQFTFLQIAPPSRQGVEKYRQYNEEVTALALRINEKYATEDWQPIVLVKENLSHEELSLLYRRAAVCLVTSLHDGMNLVAKEFAAARNDEAGVLILSQFTGAARDLKSALSINPYSAEQTAAAIYEALIMPLSEQRRRMQKMRETLKNYNVYRWSAELIKATAATG